MVKHKYYSEDTEQRKKYFEVQFFSNAKLLAQEQRIPLNQILNQVDDFESFKRILEQVWSLDSSLLSYLEGMSEEDLQEFFNRGAIQNLIREKLPQKERIPRAVVQVRKKTRRLFASQIKEKRTGRTRRVFAKPEFVVVRGKRQQRHRDSKGRFAKKL